MTKLFKRITSLAMAAVMAASAAITANAADAYENANNTTDTAFTVWANGKDVKAKKATDQKDHYYKTDFIDYEGAYTGGKWTVVVTTTETTDVLKLFNTTKDSGGNDVYSSKMTDAGKTEVKEAKEIASAKIKEGRITVTAGKKAGEFKVWLYEVKAKKIVNTTTVKPVSFSGETFVAANSLSLSASKVAEDGDTGLLKAAAKSKLADIKSGEKVTYYIADAKNNITPSCAYTATVTINGTKQEVTVSDNEISFTPSAEGKAKITVTCEESGKKGTFSVKVVKPDEKTASSSSEKD